MVDAMIAFVTCGSEQEAKKIAEALVENNLAACVNVLSSVNSCYRWEDQVQWSGEHLLVIKTTGDAVGPAHDKVIELHSYAMPEFVAFTIDEGSAAYLRWIQDSVGKAGGHGGGESEWEY